MGVVGVVHESLPLHASCGQDIQTALKCTTYAESAVCYRGLYSGRVVEVLTSNAFWGPMCHSEAMAVTPVGQWRPSAWEAPTASLSEALGLALLPTLASCWLAFSSAFNVR